MDTERIKKKLVNRKVIFEFLSITFAVFLGLMLNTWNESHKNSELAEKSMNNITTEIVKNKEKVSESLQTHKEYLITVDSLIMELEDSIKVKNRTGNLKLKFISSTSWETAKITQAVAYMNLTFVNEVSGIYEYQNYYNDLIRSYAQERMTSAPEAEDKLSLQKIQIFVSSIAEMEKNMIEYYDLFLKNKQ